MGEMTQQYSYSFRDSAPAYMYSTALVGQFIDRAGHTSYHYLIQKLAVVYKLCVSVQRDSESDLSYTTEWKPFVGHTHYSRLVYLSEFL